MSGHIQNYDFEDATQGNTYDSVLFNFNEDPANDLTGSKIYMQLRKKPGQALAAEFSIDNQKMEIISPYSFSFKSQVIEVIADTYDYDILILFPDSRRETYIGGHWTIRPAVTHKK